MSSVPTFCCVNIFTCVLEHGDIGTFLQQPQQAECWKTEELLLRKMKL